MKIFYKEGESIPQNCDCIVALPSTGNVGQIAMDSIIATLSSSGTSLRRVGNIETDLVMPMVGFEVFAEGEPKIQELCMPIEVYTFQRNTSQTTVLILQRSLCYQGSQRCFSQQLVKFLANELKCQTAIFLTGASDEDLELSFNSSMFAITTSENGVGTGMPAQTTSLLQNAYPTLYSRIKQEFPMHIQLPTPVSARESDIIINTTTTATTSINPAAATTADELIQQFHQLGLSFQEKYQQQSTPRQQQSMTTSMMAPVGVAADVNTTVTTVTTSSKDYADATALALIVPEAISRAVPRGMIATKYALETLYYSYTHNDTTSSKASTTGSSSSSSNNNTSSTTTSTRIAQNAMEVAVVGRICTEGDNISDGLQLAELVCTGFHLLTVNEEQPRLQIKHPKSWSMKFGNAMRQHSTNNMFY
mmetsp:Transcript_6330/g.10561  ORF Transcript_6330/g.10561 Transcript_6330/m.10561 type:complete len:420 (-) Transcript_6330:174-1433(-)